MALHSTGKQAHFPNYNNSLYNRGRIGPKSLNLQYEAWNSENSSKSFTATQATPLVSSQICGHKQFIRSLKTFCLHDSFGVMFQHTIYCLAMLCEILLLLDDQVCGMWVGTLQNEKTTTMLQASSWELCYEKIQSYSVQKSFTLDFFYGYVTKKQGIKKARGFMFHKKGENKLTTQYICNEKAFTHIYKTSTQYM